MLKEKRKHWKLNTKSSLNDMWEGDGNGQNSDYILVGIDHLILSFSMTTKETIFLCK